MFSDIALCSKKIILITGMTRSGKTMLCPIISSLKNCEQFFFNTVVENISVMNFMKEINFSTADHIIKKAINENIQDKILGRNINNKKNDFTSIQNYKNKKIYLKRINSVKDINFYKSKEFKNNFFPILFHEALFNLELIEKSFDFPKIVHISRHPVDLLSSWFKKNYGGEHYKSPKNTVCTYKFNKKELPFFCVGIEKEILKQKTDEDRIIKMINNLNNIFKKNYFKSLNKENIIMIKYDEFVSNPQRAIKNICFKFDLKKDKFLKAVLKEQKCPRNIDYKKRDKNYKKFSLRLSNENREIFNNMIIKYENNELTF
jgi:hypothetical protein